MAEIRRQLSPTDEAWRRKWTFPFEDRAALTTAPWRGECRWFRSSNVIPLERYRTDEEWARICDVLWPHRWQVFSRDMCDCLPAKRPALRARGPTLMDDAAQTLVMLPPAALLIPRALGASKWKGRADHRRAP